MKIPKEVSEDMAVWSADLEQMVATGLVSQPQPGTLLDRAYTLSMKVLTQKE